MSQKDPQAGPEAGPEAGPPADELDPANQSLAEALRKSFWVLKLLMMVLVILYVFSGAFTVESDEVGFKMRYGRVVGDGAAAVLRPGFHWSLPYPFEQNMTVSTSERELPVEFLYLLSETEIEQGTLELKYNNFLNPEVDDFLITGDLNIIHGKLLIKYRITDPVDYITYVYPKPTTDDPRPDHQTRFPEATILKSLVRSAVIEVAAGFRALTIRGEGQERFLHAVGRRVNDKLAALARDGTPLGISVDRDTGIIGSKVADIEAIFPPRQVQAEFDRVFTTQTEKNTVISAAEKVQKALLTLVAGTSHDSLYQALEEEYHAILALSAAESAAAADLDTLKTDVAAKRKNVEAMLLAATGMVRARISRAEGVRDTLVQEARADHDQLMRLLPEYRRNPDIFLSRKRDEVYAMALSMEGVEKYYVSGVHDVRIKIPQLRPVPGQELPADPDDDYARITIDQLIKDGRLDPAVMLITSR